MVASPFSPWPSSSSSPTFSFSLSLLLSSLLHHCLLLFLRLNESRNHFFGFVLFLFFVYLSVPFPTKPKFVSNSQLPFPQKINVFSYCKPTSAIITFIWMFEQCHCSQRWNESYYQICPYTERRETPIVSAGTNKLTTTSVRAHVSTNTSGATKATALSWCHRVLHA